MTKSMEELRTLRLKIEAEFKEQLNRFKSEDATTKDKASSRIQSLYSGVMWHHKKAWERYENALNIVATDRSNGFEEDARRAETQAAEALETNLRVSQKQ